MLQREQSGIVFCYPAPERAAIDAGGQALIEEMRRFIERFPEASAEREQFAAALYGTSETLKIDSEGRLVLPESLKVHAGIGGSVTFVGLGHKFQMWEPERFQMQLVQAPRACARCASRRRTGAHDERPAPYSRARTASRCDAESARRRGLSRCDLRRRGLFTADA